MVQRSVAAAAADGERSSDALMCVQGCELNSFNYCKCTQGFSGKRELKRAYARGSPRASAHANAALSVHPVPCVLFDFRYGCTNSVHFTSSSPSPTRSHSISTTIESDAGNDPPRLSPEA